MGGLLLARANGERQFKAIGDQSGGRVFLFLERLNLPVTMRPTRSEVCVSSERHAESRMSIRLPRAPANRTPAITPPGPCISLLLPQRGSDDDPLRAGRRSYADTDDETLPQSRSPRRVPRHRRRARAAREAFGRDRGALRAATRTNLATSQRRAGDSAILNVNRVSVPSEMTSSVPPWATAI